MLGRVLQSWQIDNHFIDDVEFNHLCTKLINQYPVKENTGMFADRFISK